MTAAPAETVAAPRGAAHRAEEPARRRPRRRWFLPTYTGLVIAYLFTPVIVMIVFGFNDYPGKFNFVWNGFTLKSWKGLFDIPELTDAIRNSVVVAGLTALIATILGTLIALALTRYAFKGRGALNSFIFLPMATPEIVLGASLLALFVTIGLTRGFVTVLIAHVMFSVSYVVVTVKARTSGFDSNLEDAAQDLGATPWTTFWTVTFPLIFPGILAAAMLAFILSLDDFVITNFNAGKYMTMPLWIFGVSRFGIPGQVNVLGTIIFMLGLVYVGVSLIRLRRAGRPPALPTRA